ncbi:Peroxisomal acyl-coenzyme A oxidase 3 [Geodia barretti]|uniref:Peroxisomal acyl-coenzyme A oxidase 3 n=1 Tax=Geodia barretti TaxID=519541 RepID=A0AA35TME9_GEOBA|nr:Peroxisomal acyl-coenzyme A oxidase 3 [Geodia barretti]
MGEKLGQNGLANGFMRFSHYAIPRESLLNKRADVTPGGEYVTPFKDPSKRFGASLGTLSSGRVGITELCVTNLRLAVCIAIRYSAVRRQFGPTPDEELPVLEYQTQQWRLLPYVAAVYVISHFSRRLHGEFVNFMIASMMGDKSDRQAELGREIHAISSTSKPLSGFTARDGIQECREACGGHGYLAVNRLGVLRDDNDPNLTYEGDNHVLLQQTSNYLLSLLTDKMAGGVVSSPLGSVDILDSYQTVLRRRFSPPSTTSHLTHTDVLPVYEWLVCHLCVESHHRLEQELSRKKNGFIAREESQVFYSHTLSLVFLEYLVVRWFAEFVEGARQEGGGLYSVLCRLGNLYSVWCLHKHSAVLYEGGYFTSPGDAQLVKDSVLHFCRELKDEAVSLVDVIAPPDFILNSPIGHSSGQVYERLFQAMVTRPGSLERPSWWKEMAGQTAAGSLHSQIAPPRAKL